MRTKRMKLKLENVGDVTFWVVIVENTEKMHKYISERYGVSNAEELGAACCLCNWKSRQIVLVYNCEWLNDYIIGHESFHAAMFFAKLNRRKFTMPRWCNMLLSWGWEETYEEDLADIAGAVVACTWDEIRPRFEFIQKEEAHNAK